MEQMPSVYCDISRYRVLITSLSTVSQFIVACLKQRSLGSQVNMFNVEGVLAPVFTPMNDSGCIDLQVIPIYVAYLKKNNIRGILGGTTGEAMSLSVTERKVLLEAWMTTAKPLGIDVIAQIGGAPLPDVLELAKHAESLQMDAIMTLPELYYKPKCVNELVSYLETVSKAAPTRPLLYYHFPMMTAVNVNMHQLFSIASSKIPNFKGVKADLGVAEQVADQLEKDQKVFIANHHIAPAVLTGHKSSIATVTNLFPELTQGIVHAVKNADVAKANMLQKELNKLVEVIASQGDFVPSMKTAMELVTGIPVGPSRQPLTPLNHNQKVMLKETLMSFGICSN